MKTQVATGATLAKKLYNEELFRDVVKETYFGPRFMSAKGDNLVHVKTDLEKGKGESIVFGLRMRLTGDGVTEGQTLEGNEEAINLHNFTTTLSRYRHGVRDDGPMTRQRTAFNITAEQEMALKDWGGEKVDALLFTALLDSPSKVFYRNSSGVSTAGSAATAISGLDATNSKISLNHIAFMKTWAKTGGNRQQIPLRPIRLDGRDMFVLLTHDDALYDLKADSTFQQAMREAMNRGDSNPLFKDAVAVWQNVVIHEHENCSIATNGGGGSVAYAKGAFMGAQALVWAWGARPKVIKKDFDYEEEQGVSWGIIAKGAKPNFNSIDYGSLGAYFARTNVSGT